MVPIGFYPPLLLLVAGGFASSGPHLPQDTENVTPQELLPARTFPRSINIRCERCRPSRGRANAIIQSPRICPKPFCDKIHGRCIHSSGAVRGFRWEGRGWQAAVRGSGIDGARWTLSSPSSPLDLRRFESLPRSPSLPSYNLERFLSLTSQLD